MYIITAILLLTGAAALVAEAAVEAEAATEAEAHPVVEVPQRMIQLSLTARTRTIQRPRPQRKQRL